MEEQVTSERRKRPRAVRNPEPGGHRRMMEDERAVVACSLLKGVHRWAEPFTDGDTCACGALYLYRGTHGPSAFEVHDG